jgi:polyphosphate kinase 2 (PPK2 family)
MKHGDYWHEFLLRPKDADKFSLTKWSPGYHGKKHPSRLESELTELGEKMSELQYKLFTTAKEAIIIVLQGIDGAGKDGTVRHVMGSESAICLCEMAWRQPIRK